MGKLTISMAIFNSYVSHYQRVVEVYWGFPKICYLAAYFCSHLRVFERQVCTLHRQVNVSSTPIRIAWNGVLGWCFQGEFFHEKAIRFGWHHWHSMALEPWILTKLGQENIGFMDFLGFELASLSSQPLGLPGAAKGLPVGCVCFGNR